MPIIELMNPGGLGGVSTSQRVQLGVNQHQTLGSLTVIPTLLSSHSIPLHV